MPLPVLRLPLSLVLPSRLVVLVSLQHPVRRLQHVGRRICAHTCQSLAHTAVHLCISGDIAVHDLSRFASKLVQVVVDVLCDIWNRMWAQFSFELLQQIFHAVWSLQGFLTNRLLSQRFAKAPSRASALFESTHQACYSHGLIFERQFIAKHEALIDEVLKGVGVLVPERCFSMPPHSSL